MSYFVIIVFAFVLPMTNVISPQETSLRENFEVSTAEEITHGYAISGDAELDAFCAGNSTTGLDWENAHVIKDYEIYLYGNGGGDCFSLTNTSRYVIFQNLTLTTSNANYDSGIYLENCSNVRIDDITVNLANTGIRMVDCTNISVFNSTIQYTIQPFLQGIYSINSNHTILRNVSIYLHTSSINTRYNGIYYENSFNTTVDQIEITKVNGYGIKFIDSTNFMILNSTIANTAYNPLFIQNGENSIVRNTSFASIKEIRFVNHQNFSFSNNSVNNLDYYELYIQSCKNGTFTDNILMGGGFYLEGISQNLTIAENNFVSGQIVKYIESESKLNLNFGGYGQIILNNVNDSVFLDGNSIDLYLGIQLLYCSNISLYNFESIHSTGGHYGLHMDDCSIVYLENSSFLNFSRAIYGNVNGLIIENCTFDGGNQNGWGTDFNQIANLSIIDSVFQNFEIGLEVRDCTGFYGRNNSIINSSLDLWHNVQVDFDTSNLLNSNPIYYLYQKYNATYEDSHPGAFIIDNSSYLVIKNGYINPSEVPIIIDDSHHIIFYNMSLNATSEYAFEITNSHNISIIQCNITGNNEAYGFDVSYVDDLNITRCYITNIEQIANTGDCNNISITENWFENFTYGFEGNDEYDITIANNALVGFDGNLTEISWLDNTDVSDNFNVSNFNSTQFGDYTFDLDQFWIWRSTGGDDNSTSTSTTTSTSTSTTTNTSTDPPADGDEGWPQWLVILLIIVGVILIAGIIVFVIRKI